MSHASGAATVGLRTWAIGSLLALLLGACGPPLAPPAPGAVPDVRGHWTGTWAGQPLSLLITGQADESGAGGLYLGPWQVLGQRTPGVTGVMTSTVRGEAVSANASGELGYLDGTLTLVVRAETTNGAQTLRLTPRGPDRLEGAGESSFRWGPRGAVELTRRPPGRPSAVPRSQEGLT
jgi:hypothetical protein